jgi:predicted DCC family thiol-disulfide oxidoreductase YuxK
LAAKLIAVFLLAHHVAGQGSFYGVRLGELSSEFGLSLPVPRLVAQAVAVGSAVLLVFNRFVPWMSIALGLSVGFEFALHRVDYRELFLGVFLFLAALQSRRREPALLRLTVVVAHLSAGLFWLVGSGSEPLLEDLAGREHASGIAPNESYLALRAAMAPELPAGLADWALAVVSFALAAGFLLRRCNALAIWAAIVLHCAWSFIAGPAGAISYAVLASYLVFTAWPQEPMAVIYDGECGFCNRTREWISEADFEQLYQWQPFQSGAGTNHGISERDLAEKVHVIAGDRIYTGFRAFRAMTLYNPASWLTAAVLLASAGALAPAIRDGVFAALILLFSPLFYPAGEASYGWISRNRHRLPPRTCKAPEP